MTNSDKTELIEVQQEVIKEVAEAFYRKHEDLQYCTYRKVYDITPEEITEDNTGYVVCSVFVQSVYKTAFDIDFPGLTANIQKYAKYGWENPDALNNEFVVLYSKGSKNADALAKKIVNLLQPGDIITMGSDGGHTVMVYEKLKNDFSLLHATGNNGENDEAGGYESKGAIKVISSAKSYLTKKASSTISVIRPLANGEYFVGGKVTDDNVFVLDNTKTYYEFSEGAKARIEYPKMDILKTGSLHNNSIVDNGDEITYSIKIKNNSDSDYEDVRVEEFISEHVNVTDVGTGDKKKQSIVWEVSVPSNSEEVITYTVQVKEKVKKGTEIVSKGEVSGIASATVTNIVGNRLNDEQIEALNANLKTKNVSKLTGLSYVNQVYIDAGIGDLGLNGKKVKDILTLEKVSLPGAKNKKVSVKILSVKSPYDNMIVNDKMNTFSNMKYFRYSRTNATVLNGNKDNWLSNYDQYVKNLESSSLQPGDILLCTSGGSERVYLCVGENKFLNASTKNCIKEKEVAERFAALPFEDYFVVLSPVLMLDK